MHSPLTQATTSPLSISEVKDFLRVDHNEEDELISGMIDQATELVERRTHRALASQQWRLVSGFFSSVELPRPPASSVDAVSYLSTDGTRKAWTAYKIEDFGINRPACLVLTDHPDDLDTSAADAWRIDYTAGGGILPRGLHSALLLITRRLYDERDGGDDTPILSTAIERMLNLYTIPNR